MPNHVPNVAQSGLGPGGPGHVAWPMSTPSNKLTIQAGGRKESPSVMIHESQPERIHAMHG